MVQCVTPGKAKKLQRLLERSRRLAVAVHNHPDGDAIGSGLALVHYFSSVFGGEAFLLVPDPAPGTLAFLTAGENITDASADPARAREILGSCDLLAILDMNAFSRADALGGDLEACKAPKILIDHHLNPDLTCFDLAFSQSDVSSASELLYWVLRALPGGMAVIPGRSLECIFTGMTTDTNNFANSVYDSTLQMASELLGAGVDRQGIIENLYQSDRPERLHAFADLVQNHMQVRDGIATIILTPEMTASYGLLEGETEGLVNIPLRMREVHTSIFLRREAGSPEFRVSIRTKKGWSANALAAGYFSGGGHEQAAGGKFPSTDPSEAAEYLGSITAARLVQK